MVIQDRKLNLERISRDDWIIGGLGALLVFDLLVLPWFSFGATINVGAATVSIGGSLTGADAPDAWLGVLSVIAVAFMVADLGFERLSPQTQLPSIGADRPLTRFALACTAAGLLALKFLLHLGRFGELGLGFWLGIMVVAALVVLTRRARQPAPTHAAGASEPPHAAEPAGVAAEASPGPTS